MASGKQEPRLSHPARRSRRLIVVALLFVAWVALIFGTSSTVLRPHEFFGLIQKVAFLSDEAMEGFRGFWGAGGYLLVVKGWHVAEFAILTLLCAAAAKWLFRRFDSWTIGGSMLFGILFAMSDEWHQTFIPDRFGTVTDVFIDTFGVAIAGAYLCWRLRRSNRKLQAMTEREAEKH
jgi:VanZ family protein